MLKQGEKTVKITRISAIAMVFIALAGGRARGDELQIHHISVGDGDATLIQVVDSGGSASLRVLIDGGKRSAEHALIPYLEAIVLGGGKLGDVNEQEEEHEFEIDNTPTMSHEVFESEALDDPEEGTKPLDTTPKTTSGGSMKFDYLILSHYHLDHYNGVADLLKLPSVQIGTLIDPGGYAMTESDAAPNTANSGLKPPARYLQAVRGAAAAGRIGTHMGMAEQGGFPAIDLGGGASLQCIVRNGSTIDGKGGLPNKKQSPNNFSIAWLLTAGEFRYFTGGDMGAGGSYFDHESLVADYFASKKMHVCAFKANHHGSAHSNSPKFLRQMLPLVCITSAGTHRSWKLPSENFIINLENDVYIYGNENSPPEGMIFETVKLDPDEDKWNREYGFFFTQIKNYGDGANSQTRAGTLAKEPGVTVSTVGSFEIVVELNEELQTKSNFQVKRRQGDGEQNDDWQFKCHWLIPPDEGEGSSGPPPRTNPSGQSY